MLAYRDHINMVQAGIDKIKNDSNDKQYFALKQKKIDSLESKLALIRKQALFLGDMSEMHKKAIKEKKLVFDRVQSEKVFLQEQMLRVRKESKIIKQKLRIATKEYDQLY